jgi:hypothetical protein
MLQESDPAELNHLLHGLAAFLQEHQQCGELDGGADDTVGPMTRTGYGCPAGAGFDLADAGARQSTLSASRQKALDAVIGVV